ncbi:DUF4148 domain-containing protein [Paraburkholderia sp. Tr-20389]|uniref:DUF4148 domain-containing protein n=1 Tax=Paraburkholderia sp. Tr-20389 TaxID=2703903 RepID=UPI00197E25EA|nr:DUF4148 domain-containing protein [Paraburkholderia sp. Tr-20389]MBN3756243.1 DUF4148 domain-containing protein [Paraburkholderia sp. Tr-20389]
MNRIFKLVAPMVVLFAPTLSFAQSSNGPPTRAAVREELAQLVKAGYRPTGRDNKYPGDLQAAQARVAAGAPGHSAVPGQSAPTTAPNAQHD